MSTSESTFNVVNPRHARRTAALRRARQAARENPLAVVGALCLVVMVIVAVFAHQLAPEDPNAIQVRQRLLVPSGAHWFGTDEFGRDIFSRVLVATRVSFLVPLGSLLIATALATAIGLTSGFWFGTIYDSIVQRFVEAIQVIPGLVLALVILATLDRGELSLSAVLITLFIAGPSRVIRGATLGIRGADYVLAARAVGAGTPRLLLMHVLPNVVPTILVVFSISVGAAILVASSLDFLGYGIPAPAPSWGGMVGGNAREYMQKRPLMAVFPGLMIVITVWSVNMVGDALRDQLDPRMRGH